MMKLLISLMTFIALSNCGHITHNGKATSYQTIHMEHYHAVPTYIKKEDKQYISHPVSVGKSGSKIQVHHGDKHDPGYAITNVEGDVHGHGQFEETSHDSYVLPETGHEEIQYQGGGQEEHQQHLFDQAQLEYAQQQGAQHSVDLGHYQQLAAVDGEQAYASHGLGHYQAYQDSR